MILRFPAGHPAREFLISHQRFRNEFFGFEIEWQGRPARFPDLQAYSSVLGKVVRLFGILCGYFSFTQVLMEWIEQPPNRTPSEVAQLKRIEECRSVIDEMAGHSDLGITTEHSRLFDQMRLTLDLWEQAVVSRY